LFLWGATQKTKGQGTTKSPSPLGYKKKKNNNNFGGGLKKQNAKNHQPKWGLNKKRGGCFLQKNSVFCLVWGLLFFFVSFCVLCVVVVTPRKGLGNLLFNPHCGWGGFVAKRESKKKAKKPNPPQKQVGC